MTGTKKKCANFGEKWYSPHGTLRSNLVKVVGETSTESKKNIIT